MNIRLLFLSLAFAANLYAQVLHAQQNTSLHLIPQPHEVKSIANKVPLTSGITIAIPGKDAQDLFAADDLRQWCKQLGISSSSRGEVNIILLRRDSKEAQQQLQQAKANWDDAMHEEGYALVADGEHRFYVIAESASGIFYGVQTVKQLMQREGATVYLQMVTLTDWPSLRHRGVSDDLSRGAIPTLETMKREVRTLASFKTNTYLPYFEASFFYPSDPLATPQGSSITPEEMHELTAYAAQYHITVLPEQEAFGHLHRLLSYQKYADIAETPLGTVLAPAQPKSLDLIADRFQELSNDFPGTMLHIGADETFDLGRGQTKDLVIKEGLGKVYVDYLIKVHDKLAPLHRKLLFWGDIAVSAPDQVKRIPKDMIAVAWKYEPSDEGYAKWIKPYTEAGIQTWVASGVNNWRRVYPDNNDAFRNIQRMALDAQEFHATGMINTVWNDDGEVLFPNTWYGLLYGAAASWQTGKASTEIFQRDFGIVFHGDNSGLIDQAQKEMMLALEPLSKDEALQMTDVLFWMDPWSLMGGALGSRLAPNLVGMRTHAERAIELAEKARKQTGIREVEAIDALVLGARKLDFIGLKYQSASIIQQTYKDAFAAQTDPKQASTTVLSLWNIGGWGGMTQDLRDGYTELNREYFTLWDKTYRPYYRENIALQYQASAMLWQQRSDALFQALIAYRAIHKLPPPESVLHAAH